MHPKGLQVQLPYNGLRVLGVYGSKYRALSLKSASLADLQMSDGQSFDVSGPQPASEQTHEAQASSSSSDFTLLRSFVSRFVRKEVPSRHGKDQSRHATAAFPQSKDFHAFAASMGSRGTAATCLREPKQHPPKSHCACSTMWEFPKIGDPNIVP